MKKILFLSLVMSSVISLNAQLFNQDFSSSTTVADYISTTPNAGQFYAISADNASLAKTIDNGALKISRTGNVAFSAYRNYSFTTNPTFVQLKFDFKATSLGTIVNPLLMFLIGNSFTSSSNGVTSNFATRFGLKPGTVTGNLKAYIIDAVGGSAPASADFDPAVYQTFTLIVNNSGADRTYIAPDATEETLTTGKLDFWIGTARAFNDFGLYNTDAVKGGISGFKFQTGSTTSGLGDFYFDNFEFTDLGGTGVLTSTPSIKSNVNITAFPNPTVGAFELKNLPATTKSIKLNLYSIDSKLIESKTYDVNNGTVQLNMADKTQGIYFIKGNAGNPFTVKLIKN